METIVVTGAAGGMGVALCQRLLTRGWAVVGLDQSATRLEALASESRGMPFTPVCADLAAPDLLDRLTAPVAGKRVVGLVNLAGISVGSSIDSLTDAAWERSLAVNTTAPMRLAKFCAPLMQAAGGGSIVNVSSPVGLIGAKKPSYAASKGALHGLTMSLARNLGTHGIRVNLLLPGPTITHMTTDWPDERRAAIAASSFLGRLCTPEDVAGVIAFLLSTESSYMTGSVVDLTAGSMFTH